MRAAKRRAWALLLVAAAALGGVDCSKQLACRPGTVFVNVDLGPHTTATDLDVDVSVNGGAPRRTTLPIDSGARRGGIEVQFPGGYPDGDPVTIVVTLRQSTTVLASRGAEIDLTDECAAVDVSFGGGDGGGGGQSGRGGSAGGGAGAGGVAGSAGAAGAAGAAGGAGRGGAGAAAGAAGGPAGAGGVAGAAGRGGAGGVAGAAGAAGRGGAGGTGGMCVSTPESCFNGRDDDCDGRIDCADSDCSPTVAHCVGLDPGTGGRVGVMINAATACPTAYPDMMAAMQNLTPGSCSGCTCSRPATGCSTTIAAFSSPGACTAGSMALPSVPLTTAMDCVTPAWMTSYVFGMVAGPFTPTVNGACTPSGTPVAATPTWATSGRFCSTTTIGGGCNAGQVCVPNVTSPPGRCQMFDGAHACPIGATSTAWYTGYSGAQACGACSCSQTAAASCAAMSISIGSAQTCGMPIASISTGGQACFSQTSEPGVRFVGTPTPPTCQATSSAGAGTLSPTGLKTLCCLP